MTPEERLCSRTWRMRNSIGVLWSILSMGFLTAVSLLYRGRKMRDRRWLAYGAGFAVVSVALLYSTSLFEAGTRENPISSTELTTWGWIWITQFAAGVWLSIATNKKWLLWRAHSGDQPPWYLNATQSDQSGQQLKHIAPSAPAEAEWGESPAAREHQVAPTDPMAGSSAPEHGLPTDPQSRRGRRTLDI